MFSHDSGHAEELECLALETKTYDRKEIDGRENRVYCQRKSMGTQIDLNNVDGQTRKLD